MFPVRHRLRKGKIIAAPSIGRRMRRSGPDREDKILKIRVYTLRRLVVAPWGAVDGPAGA